MISMERHGAGSMKWHGVADRHVVRVAALVLVAILGSGRPAPAADALDPLAGVWRDATVLEQQDLDLLPGDLDRTITIAGAQVTLRRRTADGGAAEVTLVGGERSAVLQVAPASSGLLGRLFSPGQGSPLDGDRLIWARIDGAALIVYGLAIDGSGHFTIEQERHAREGDQLRVEVTRLRFGAEPVRAVAMLVRRKG